MNEMTSQSVRVRLLLPIAALCLLSAATPAQTPPPAAPSAAMPQDHMQEPTMKGMDNMQKMPMTGDPDKDFAMMMKMHHEKGVEMATMELKNGKSPAMRAMAKQIVAAQNKEIAEFDKWLAKQK
ncbi:MAG: DUF305 domain-containing protein [Gammaproteobacteria bacterium]